MNLLKKISIRLLLPLALLYAILLIPDSDTTPEQQSTSTPFAWNRDTTWQGLEHVFQQAQHRSPAAVDSAIAVLSATAERYLESIQHTAFAPTDTVWNSMLNNFFAVAPLVAVQRDKCSWLINYYSTMRIAAKRQSQAWDMDTEAARHTLYTTLYGMRAAVEEVLLVADSNSFSPVLRGYDEPSATPSTTLLGITVHSGDLLVSRGGAEVSALISRGNDYPGNFSHVALLYVDSATRTPYFIEAHIERGVAIATAKQYIADKKLRFMVLRPRADIPAIAADPSLPHKAASHAYREAQTRHIPYDFQMNFHDSTAMFCSEVGSYAYKHYGIQLWQAVSTISSPGVVNWLHTFGVENFVTQMPSDLEYDPQLSVVAEWRDPETLRKDHIDNAVIDVLLERADAGETIGYNIWALPFVRVIKAYCVVLNWFGKEGIIPEGMSATRALKNNTFVDKHVQLKQRTEQAVQSFTTAHGYTPPYWQLVALAKQQATEAAH